MIPIRTKCGVYGIYSNISSDNIIQNTINGLFSLQHRGRETCGISYLDNNKLEIYKTIGEVSNIQKKFKKKIITNSSIGHVRYSTSGKHGDCSNSEIQPIYSKKLNISLSYNGNIPFFESLTHKYKNTIQNVNNDTDFIIKYLESIDDTFENSLINFMSRIAGVYSIIIQTPNELYCLRDRFGYKPLFFIKDDKNYIVSSENSSFNIKKILNSVEVNPGQIIKINKNGLRNIFSYNTSLNKTISMCSFEYIYFLNKKTFIDNNFIEDIRANLGIQLALLDNTIYSDNTIVVGSPNSGIIPGESFATEKGILYKQVLTKLDKGRTFILPENDSRKKCIAKNIVLDTSEIQNKDIIIVDDSIVRGNTMKHIVNLLRINGARNIHVRIASPPIISPCYYGIDIPTYEELIASKKTLEEIKNYINSDSLKYISVEILKKVIGTKRGLCTTCFTNNHNRKKFEW